MFNLRWSYSGTLDQICEELCRARFCPTVFLIVSKDPGWYNIDGDTWLLYQSSKDDHYCLYYWPDHDPRPFLRDITTLKGFK